MQSVGAVLKAKLLDTVIAGTVAVTILLFTFIRLSHVPVELDLRTTSVDLTLVGSDQGLSFPGEKGEIVQLNEALISGSEQTEQSIPHSYQQDSDIVDGDIVDLKAGGRQIASKSANAKNSPRKPLVHLQEILTPSNMPFDLHAAIEYGPRSPGLSVILRGPDVVTAQLSEEVILPGGEPAFNYVSAKGRSLTMHLFPTDKRLTLVRDLEISRICFAEEKRSGLLSGTVVVKNRTEGSFKVEPGDRLMIASDQNKPMLLRELTFVDGQVRARLSAEAATSIQLGGNAPQNLMPTVFDFLRAGWPTQMYGTLSAVLALWFALRSWWASDAKGTEEKE